jgi:hypothetical protein
MMQPPDSTDLKARLQTVLAQRFEVGALLGLGGYAAVFRARDLVLERDVAIKVFEAGAAMALDQCLAEARLVATIEHPHIVPLYEVGCESGIVFLVMRLFPDGSLAGRIAAGERLSPEHVTELGATVADALAVAHERGVVHLDIKPDNILLDPAGRAAVTDFGIAQAVGAASGEHVSSGTPHYMSPEHVAGDTLDGRSDVYALGVVLYEAATGRPPITGTTATQVMANQVRQSVPPIASVVPEFPTALAAVISKALAKDPAERWQSAAELATALREVAASGRLLSPAALAKQARRRWIKRGAAGCVLVTIGLGIAGYLAITLAKALTGGPHPAVSVAAPMIPPAVIDSLVGFGLLEEGDTALYIFVPDEHPLADAFVVTQRGYLARHDGVLRRWAGDIDWAVDLALRNKTGYFIISSPDGTAHDTLYNDLEGRELTTVREGITRALRSPPAPGP